MPKLIVLYLSTLLCYRTPASCMMSAEVLETVPHGRLTRVLQGSVANFHLR